MFAQFRFMEIAKTKEFILRHVKLSDAQVLFDIEIDKDNIKNMMSYDNKIESIIEGIKKQQAQYRKKNPSNEQIIIETPEGVAGYVSIHGLNKPYVEHKASISYGLHPKFRGKGLTTKAVKLITNYAFKKYNLKRIDNKDLEVPETCSFFHPNFAYGKTSLNPDVIIYLKMRKLYNN
jgi:RimJ/RimL family protein N-acetyltransferase